MDLHVESGAGRRAARLCERAAQRLARHHDDLMAASPLAGGALGDCAEGRGWSRLLWDTATGQPSLRWLLEHHIAALTRLAEEFRAVERGLDDADGRHGTDIGRTR